jgi:hypothetical protein
MKLDHCRSIVRPGLIGLLLSTLVACSPPRVFDTVPVRVEFDPPATTLGGSSWGTVFLKEEAGKDGQLVGLSPNPASALSAIPPSVTVPAGDKSARFKVTVSNSATATSVTVTASTNKGSEPGELEIID